MDLLFIVQEVENINNKRKIYRKAYRGIIQNDGLVLMIQSKKYGEVKFPGGGKEIGEHAYQVIRREVEEETGYLIKSRIHPFGKTYEIRADNTDEMAVFFQESRYYFCSITKEQVSQKLDDYEEDYGYQPVWISLEEALKINRSIPKNDAIPWKERDTLVIKKLMEMRDSIES